MIPEPIDDATLERYVLGRLEQADLDSIETWLIATPDAPALVDAIELELAERYLDGALPEAERADFARALRTRPELASRLAVVEALRDRARAGMTAAPATAKTVLQFPRDRWFRQSWVPATLAAALILAAGLAVRLQMDRTRLESEVAALRGREAAAAHAAGAPGAITPSRLATAAPLPDAVVAFTLSAGGMRSGGPVPLVVTAPGTRLVRLHLKVAAGTPPVRAQILDGDSVEQMRRGPLTPVSDAQGTSVDFDVPVSVLPTGDYQIILRPAEGGTSPAYTYSFRVAGPAR
jgi:hypothetical protein